MEDDGGRRGGADSIRTVPGNRVSGGSGLEQ